MATVLQPEHFLRTEKLHSFPTDARRYNEESDGGKHHPSAVEFCRWNLVVGVNGTSEPKLYLPL